MYFSMLILLLLYNLIHCQIQVSLDKISNNKITDNVKNIKSPKWFTSEKNEELLCRENYFHPADMFALYENIYNFEDCVQICEMNKQCHSMTHMTQLNKCYLFTKTKNESILPLENLQSIHCNFAKARSSTKNDTAAIQVPESGGAPATCGISFFPMKNGESQSRRHKRIINGHEAAYYSLPWVVQIVAHPSQMPKCTGSLISTNPKAHMTYTVLTAAHCFVEIDDNETMNFSIAKNHLVIAGRHNAMFTEAHEQIRRIRNCTFHEMYIKQNQISPRKGFKNDIVLIQVEEAFIFNNYVRQLCLPNEGDMITKDKEQCYIAGWGLVKENPWSNDTSMMVKAVSLNYGKVNVSTFNMISTFLLQKLEVDNLDDVPRTSGGDSGGPLFCKNDNSSFSIYAFVNGASIDDKEKKLTLVYTRINFYLKWIKENEKKPE